MAAVLTVAVPVFAIGMASLPAYVVTLASLSGVESATGLAHVLLNTVGLTLLLMVVLSHRRRLRGRCPRCGAGHTGGSSGPLVHPPASTAPRRTRIQVYLLMCGLLPWAAVKTVWTLGGDALGVTAEKWREENAGGSGVAKALASVGIDVTVLAALAGILLLLGLMYPWGQTFPRWTPFLTGRRVPRLLPSSPHGPQPSACRCTASSSWSTPRSAPLMCCRGSHRTGRSPPARAAPGWSCSVDWPSAAWASD
ncbi:hypothetical protein [Streptomyces rhizosphaericus]|uniref:hypothetical protein n=1 Tax=Streptomyces rhizosphaericus TaxID=114699 RepID=UPI00364250D5